jgi:hypothetical protein
VPGAQPPPAEARISGGRTSLPQGRRLGGLSQEPPRLPDQTLRFFFFGRSHDLAQDRAGVRHDHLDPQKLATKWAYDLMGPNNAYLHSKALAETERHI